MEKKLNVRRLNDVISVSSQIHEKDIAEIAKLGFRTIINNRPDQEGGDIQPFSADLGTAAASRGIEYHYLPVVASDIRPSDAKQFKEILACCPKPVFAFCRSGNRTTKLFKMSKSLTPSL
mmetsp:Transcript_56682/g.149365  ORF Transcript_56682/g.149365 Transcript_56682/m.149365 type:complete len:120 (-) Transcript_56682:264-623(-)